MAGRSVMALLLLALGSTARADQVVLANGSVLEGTLVTTGGDDTLGLRFPGGGTFTVHVRDVREVRPGRPDEQAAVRQRLAEALAPSPCAEEPTLGPARRAELDEEQARARAALAPVVERARTGTFDQAVDAVRRCFRADARELALDLVRARADLVTWDELATAGALQVRCTGSTVYLDVAAPGPDLVGVVFPPGTYAEPPSGRTQARAFTEAPVVVTCRSSPAQASVPSLCANEERQGESERGLYTLHRFPAGSQPDRVARLLCSAAGHELDEGQKAMWAARRDRDGVALLFAGVRYDAPPPPPPPLAPAPTPLPSGRARVLTPGPEVEPLPVPTFDEALEQLRGGPDA